MRLDCRGVEAPCRTGAGAADIPSLIRPSRSEADLGEPFQNVERLLIVLPDPPGRYARERGKRINRKMLEGHRRMSSFSPEIAASIRRIAA